MKSAYELAMERLEKHAPSAHLTDAQKAEIADIESFCKARIAEKELLLRGQIAKAKAAGQLGDVEDLERQLASEIRRIREGAEAKKEKVRNGGKSSA
jgi:hypothetical protein